MQKNRRSIRLKEYDYSEPGEYFVTICTKDRVHLFGNIDNDGMHENELGNIVRHCWIDIPKHFPNVELDEFVVMPNHVHGIIDINPSRRDQWDLLCDLSNLRSRAGVERMNIRRLSGSATILNTSSAMMTPWIESGNTFR